MFLDPASERSEMALILGRLIGVLAHVGEGLSDPADTVGTWSDEHHVYLEAALTAACDSDRLDLCLHDGRLFVAAMR